MVALSGVVLAGCSSSAPSPRPSGSPSSSPSASLASGPCASVHVTTAIEQAPAACAALWSPYQVTKVPPPDILQQEHIPAAPPVRNVTNGAISDAVAQHWADANNADSGWFKWAEANGQLAFLAHLAGPDVILPADSAALAQGASISQPDCNLYPTMITLAPIGADGVAYFTRKGLPTDNQFVLIQLVTITAPCNAIASYPDGHQSPIPALQQTTTVFAAGKLQSDHVLGDIWFSDAGGGCSDPTGPPSSWCHQ
jgi:hypothetical protein